MNRRHFTASALGWSLCPWSLMAESSSLLEVLTRRSYEIARRLTTSGWRTRDGLYHVQMAAAKPPALELYLLPQLEYLIVISHRPKSQLSPASVPHEIKVQLLTSAEDQVVAEGQYIDDPGATIIKYQPSMPQRLRLKISLNEPENDQELVALCCYR